MMSVIFYYYLLLQCVVGAVLVVNNVDHHYIVDKLQFQESRLYGYAAVMYTIIAMPIGMIFANNVWKVKNIGNTFNNYCRESIREERRYNDKTVKISCLIVSFIALLATIYVTVTIGEISIFKLLGSSPAEDLALFRTETSREFPGNNYVKNIFGLGLTPLMSYVAYAYKLRENTRFNKLWFWVMFIATIQIVSYNLEKSPIVVYLIGFLFFRVYTNHPITKKQLIIIGSLIILLLIGMYIKIMNAGVDILSLFSYNSGIVGRITLSSIAGLFFNFDLWPSSEEYLGFSSISQFLSGLIGSPYSERAARIIMERVNPSGIEMGSAGVMNSLFIGEAWSNWGIVGLVVSPILVGFLIQNLYVFFLRSRKTPFYLALFVNFSFKSSITGGVNDYLYNVQAIIMIFLIIGIYGFSKILLRSLVNEKKNNFPHSVKTQS